MNLDWAKRMEDHLEERMEEVNVTMSDMTSGVRKYLKRKDDGTFNYMYCIKKRNGEIDYLLKAGEGIAAPSASIAPAVASAVASTVASSNPPTQDSDTDGEGGPTNGEREVESNNLKTSESDDEEEEDKEGGNQLSTQLAVASSLSRTNCQHTTVRVCGLCSNQNCHAAKYGQFLRFLTLPFYTGQYEQQKGDISSVFEFAYHIINDYDKIQEKHDGVARVIVAADLEEPMPACMERVRSKWLEHLKNEYNASNGTYENFLSARGVIKEEEHPETEAEITTEH